MGEGNSVKAWLGIRQRTNVCVCVCRTLLLTQLTIVWLLALLQPQKQTMVHLTETETWLLCFICDSHGPTTRMPWSKCSTTPKCCGTSFYSDVIMLIRELFLYSELIMLLVGSFERVVNTLMGVDCLYNIVSIQNVLDLAVHAFCDKHDST